MVKFIVASVTMFAVNFFGLTQASSQPPAIAKLSAPALKSLWTRSNGDDWPQFLGPRGDGTSNETGILTDWSDGKLAVVWKKELGEGYGIGSVSAGRYFQFDRLADQARVRCFNAETGEDLWQFEYQSKYQDLYNYDSGPRTSPVIDGDRVYLYGVEGMLHCLSAETGAEIWKLDTAKKWGVIQNFFGVASTPVVAGELLLVMVGGSPPESQDVPPGALDRVKSDGSGIVAVDKMTGEVRYTLADELASYAGIKLAELDGRLVGYALLRGSLIGFDVVEGKIFLEYPFRSRILESVNASTPVVKSLGDTNQVLLTECYGLGGVLLSVTRDGHDVVWSDQKRREKSMEAHMNTPVIAGEYLYGCSGRHPGDAKLRCINWLSGEINWSQPGFERCSLLGIDGHFVLIDEAGKLVLVKANSKKYEQVTEYDDEIRFKPPCWAAPIVSHGLLYVRGRDQLICFRLIP